MMQFNYLPGCWIFHRSIFIAALSLLCVIQPCSAISPEELTFERLFTGKFDKAEDLFSPSFLQMVSESQIRQVAETYVQTLGDYQGCQKTEDGYQLYFVNGTAPATITLNNLGLVISLWLGAARLDRDSPGEILAEARQIEGTVSICLVRNGRDVLMELEPDLPMAVGSAFKMYILKAMHQEMDNGALGRDTIIRIKNEHKSLPSGILQNWPAGSVLTIDAVAKLMISLSDNTATDHLLHYLGRNRVEALAPPRMAPFLSTAEFFKLKWGLPSHVTQSYIDGDTAERRAILAEQVRNFPLEDVHFTTDPVYVDKIEWFATTLELCDVLNDLRSSDAMTINPGLVNPAEWHRVCYKGGSEPGVLNYSILLQAEKEGDYYALSVTVNDTHSTVNEAAFNDMTGRIINLIQRGRESFETEE